jgi:hypothetical protein
LHVLSPSDIQRKRGSKTKDISQVLLPYADDLRVWRSVSGVAEFMEETESVPGRGTEFMDDIVKDFLIESRENLDRLDQELVSLESDPTSKDSTGQYLPHDSHDKGQLRISGVLPVRKGGTHR